MQAWRYKLVVDEEQSPGGGQTITGCKVELQLVLLATARSRYLVDDRPHCIQKP